VTARFRRRLLEGVRDGAAHAEVAREEQTSRYQVARAFGDGRDQRRAARMADLPRRCRSMRPITAAAAAGSASCSPTTRSSPKPGVSGRPSAPSTAPQQISDAERLLDHFLVAVERSQLRPFQAFAEGILQWRASALRRPVRWRAVLGYSRSPSGICSASVRATRSFLCVTGVDWLWP
jgi:hypothetical protein